MADKVFVNDEILITLSTGKILTMYAILRVKFEKPNGIKGYWTAAIHPTINTKMQATVYFDMEGIWKSKHLLQMVLLKSTTECGLM